MLLNLRTSQISIWCDVAARDLVSSVLTVPVIREHLQGAVQLGGSWHAEVGVTLYQDLFSRLQSCWADCGPSQAIASFDEVKLACMASVLNSMRMLYAFLGSGVAP